MSKRKVVSDVVSGSNGKLVVNDTFMNNLLGDITDKHRGKLELGSTLLDVTKGLKLVTSKKMMQFRSNTRY